jgi:hypothetical protein
VPVVALDAIETGNPVDVDQLRRVRQPIFIMGRRLCPPARMRVSSPPSAFAAIASSTECAAT